MLEHFFDSPLRVQALRNGPSGSLLEGFAQELWEVGYSRTPPADASEPRSISFTGRTKKAYLAVV